MNILITGAYGFLGRYIAKAYKVKGAYIVGIGHGKWEVEEYAKWGIDIWYNTTVTFESLMNINKKFDLIVHCGGSGSVGFSWENPYEDFQKSVQSTLSVLEFLRLQNNKCKLIYPSSPAVQGNLGAIKIRENMVSLPVSPYGFHKKIAEELCLSYHHNYNIDIGIIRYFSIYGVGLKKQLLWDACKKISQQNSPLFFGTGNETRDWIHVSDAVSLLNVFAEKLSGFDVINGGTGVSVTINIILKQLAHYLGKKVLINYNGINKAGDPIHFCADTEKSDDFGWKPKVKLENGLEEYVNYFKELQND
jgi:UDP-glucose 4-epimerase